MRKLDKALFACEGISGYKNSGTLNACYSVFKVRCSSFVYAVTSNFKSKNCFCQTDYGVSEWTAETDKATEMSASLMKSASFAQKLNVAAGRHLLDLHL